MLVLPSQVIGNGSFGVVYQARLVDSQEMVAIKKVLQDKRFKVRLMLKMSTCCVRFFFSPGVLIWFVACILQNRELQIMRKLDHCNIVRLRYFFYSSGEKVAQLLCCHTVNSGANVPLETVLFLYYYTVLYIKYNVF